MLSKEDLIKYILERDASLNRSYLEKLNLEALVIQKVQIELALHRQDTITKNTKKEGIPKKN